jgi:hypothetical protein
MSFERFLLGLVVLLLVGCASQTFPPETAPAAKILRDRALFYRSGPLQAAPADARLPRDTPVLVLRKEFGYSLVQLEDERTGFVANEDLVPVERSEIVFLGGEPSPLESEPVIEKRRLPSPVDDAALPQRDFESLPGDLPSALPTE